MGTEYHRRFMLTGPTGKKKIFRPGRSPAGRAQERDQPTGGVGGGGGVRRGPRGARKTKKKKTRRKGKA